MKPAVDMVGRLTRQVTNVFGEGTAKRAVFTTACNSYYKAKGGEKKESVDFVPCICWGGLVDIMTTWGLKGRLIHIKGTLETFQAGPNEDGKYPPTRVQVKVDQLQFLDKKPENVQTPAAQTPGASGNPLDGIDLAKFAELVAAKMLGPANAGTQTPESTQDETAANAQAEEAANAQAEAGGADLNSVI